MTDPWKSPRKVPSSRATIPSATSASFVTHTILVSALVYWAGSRTKSKTSSGVTPCTTAVPSPRIMGASGHWPGADVRWVRADPAGHRVPTPPDSANWHRAFVLGNCWAAIERVVTLGDHRYRRRRGQSEPGGGPGDDGR